MLIHPRFVLMELLISLSTNCTGRCWYNRLESMAAGADLLSLTVTIHWLCGGKKHGGIGIKQHGESKGLAKESFVTIAICQNWHFMGLINKLNPIFAYVLMHVSFYIIWTDTHDVNCVYIYIYIYIYILSLICVSWAYLI